MSHSDHDNAPRRASELAASSTLETEVALLCEGRHPNPFSILGRHSHSGCVTVRTFLPGAEQVRLVDCNQFLQRVGNTDLFQWQGVTDTLPLHYRLAWIDADGRERTMHDPYSFGPQISLYDLHLFNEGRHLHVYRFLGAHSRTVEGITGVLFAVWAPNATQVSVIGDFNNWDGRVNPMRRRGGVWELFIPGLGAGARYQFEVHVSGNGAQIYKTDPYGHQFERRPATAAIITDQTPYPWRDEGWTLRRRRLDWTHTPIAIYEVHLGSWQRNHTGGYLGYEELAQRLVAYVTSLGFTHIELMPITEHPLDASWGYQPTGYFAPTSRHGTPAEFRRFVEYCHQAGIGVILDWVPGHFPKDSHGLAQFDGTYLYEHEDPARREHRGWGTLVFNYGRNQVKNFLLASACYWLEEFHLDGLRVDAVASMLYLDYARESGDWSPNPFGGNENLEAIAFLRELNDVIHRRYPGVMMIAEESTAWPLVTRPVWMGGLGFGMKWNMGWMHDTLEYLSHDPAFRRHCHDLLTFGLLYAFSENFMLPLSHDEVVHGKHSLLHKMSGDRQQRFANLRLLYVYMWTYPGKKFLFMGNEFAQEQEWNHADALDWDLLRQPAHRGIQLLLRDLNHMYRSIPSLYGQEFSQEGFVWLDCQDVNRSVVVYLRHYGGSHLAVVVLNFAAVVHSNLTIGVPLPGLYREILNSDACLYGGTGMCNGEVCAIPVGYMGQPYSFTINLPPLTGMVFTPYPAKLEEQPYER